MENKIKHLLENYKNHSTTKSGEYIIAWNEYEHPIVVNTKNGDTIKITYTDYTHWVWTPNDKELMAKGDHIMDIIDPKTGKIIRNIQGYF